MSSNRSPWVVIGPIIGFLLLYVIIRYGVTGFRTDMEHLGEYGVATLQEVQSTGEAGEAMAEEEAANAEAANAEAANAEATEEGSTEAESEATESEAVPDEAVEAPAADEAAEDTAIEDAGDAEEDSTPAAADEEPAAEDTTPEEGVDASAEEPPADDVTDEEPAADEGAPSTADTRGGKQGTGNGIGAELRDRHMVAVHAEYAGLVSPVSANAESIARGQEQFTLLCASCHGDEGLGDGPAAAGLDPAPPMIAQTSLMLEDDFLFWRISEGGSMDPFNSAMPAWKAVLDEEARWDVINYVRSLGGAEAMGQGGGQNGSMRAQMQAAAHEEMLAAGIEQGVIDEAEATLFERVHGQLDAYKETVDDGTSGSVAEMQDEWLAALADSGDLSQADAEAFADIQARLQEAGMMPQ